MFKVGTGTRDEVNNYGKFFIKGDIQGYGVALNDANSGKLCNRGTRGTGFSIRNDNAEIISRIGNPHTQYNRITNPIERRIPQQG